MNDHTAGTDSLSSDGYMLQPGTGRHLRLPAGPLTLKVDSAASHGSIAVWEDTVSPGSGPPLHIHHLCEELFFVIDGDFEFQLGKQRCSASCGSFLFIPRGMRHTYRCTGPKSGKLLGIVTPAGLERFYEAQTRVPPGQMTPQLYAELGRAYDLDVV